MWVVDAAHACREHSSVTAKASALHSKRGYELIYRYFERTLIHERRYQYFGQDQNAFTFPTFASRPTTISQTS
jgi:hypothetical protein